MRRPAQHRTGPAAPGWAHPYTGTDALAVFYNDGGNPPVASAGDPSPAPQPPKPAPPVTPTVSMTQDELNALAAKEKDQGKRAGARQALEDFAKEHGFSNVDDAKAFIATARQAQQEALSEQERAQQQLEADRKRIEQQQAEIASTRRAMQREQALTRLGALDVLDDQGQVAAPNLQDALAILERELRDTPDAEPADVAAAAARVKQRHPALFGQAPAPQSSLLPPAPGGAPATGQRPGGATHKPGDQGREMLRRRGKVRDTAA
jgi:F0F1-type ATP synthase epsilon subunit